MATIYELTADYLEVLEMVLEHFINNGNYGNYMLFGEVKEVLSKNCLI